MLADSVAADVRSRLTALDYTVESVVAAIGGEAHAALGRNQTAPAVRALAGRDDPLATLITLWLLQQPVATAQLERALGSLTGPLTSAGIIGVDDTGRARARVDVRPYAADDGPWWICADLTPGLDGVLARPAPDFVLGVSSASSSLAQITPRRRVDSALDLGTGCGVQSLHLSRHADRVVATDVNERALALAGLTFALNGVRVDRRRGDLYAPVRGERFDLITTNPPYVISPPGHGPALVYRESGRSGDGIVEEIVRRAPAHLAEGGTMQVLANWIHPRGGDWRTRLAGWVEGQGCDLHVLQREVLDPCAYAELWLADAGRTGSPDYRREYSDWLEHFDRLGIEAVGLGWIVLRRTDAAPEVVCEDWPYAVEQPVGPALTARLGAVDLLRDSPEGLFATRWVLADDVIQETSGRPGAEDPEHIVVRRQRGLRRAHALDTALAGVLGACDGELSAGALSDAVARLLNRDPTALRTEIAPGLRSLVLDGFVTPALPGQP